jgi:hypothetical protein
MRRMRLKFRQFPCMSPVSMTSSASSGDRTTVLPCRPGIRRLASAARSKVATTFSTYFREATMLKSSATGVAAHDMQSRNCSYLLARPAKPQAVCQPGGAPSRKLGLFCPFYTMLVPVPSAPLLRVVRKEAVLPIFWTLRIVRPMSDEGGNGHSRVPILSFPPSLTRANKESPDMKRAMFSVLTLIVLAGLTGCATQHGRHPLMAGNGTCAPAAEGCQPSGATCEASCDNGCASDEDPGCRTCRLRRGRPCREQEQEVAAPGPATGAVTYPYYTVRGPRDFLAKGPSSIGP